MKKLVLLLLLPLQIAAQDITGVWTGFIHTTDKNLPYELAIGESNGKLGGYSHTIFTINGVEELGVKAIKVKSKNGNVLIEDEALVYNDYTEAPAKRVRQFSSLELKIEDSIMILTGTFKTNKTQEFRSLSGTIRLQKKIDFQQTKIIPKLDELHLLNTLSFLQPKIKDKEVIAAVSKPLEKTDTAKPVQKEIADVPPPTAVKETATILTSKKQEIVKSDLPVKRSKQPIVINEPKLPKQIVTPPPVTVKVQPVPQPKEKQVVVVPKKVIEKKEPPAITPQPKKEVALVVPPKQNLPAIQSSGSAAEIAKRKTETIQSVYFKSDSLVISLYDNGEVDGDTVSVLLNGRIIIANQGLTTNAITKTIYVTPDLGDSMQLVMYAENLGSIPPNTGLLILQDGNDRYEIRFAGDFQKNSAIILRRRRL